MSQRHLARARIFALLLLAIPPAAFAQSHPSSAVVPAASRPAEAPPAGINPKLKYQTLADYEKAIQQPGVMLDSPHVRLFAPKARSYEAGVIFPYLVKAYDELYRITGRHTEYKVVVYHLRPSRDAGWGGTETSAIWYTFDDLDLAKHEEWTGNGIPHAPHVPHVAGYIEEMAHNFVDAAHVQFGWEMVGWSIGIKVTQKIANNPILAREIEETRQVQLETYQRYIRAGYVFPQDIKPNLSDRIHAWILHLAEMKYGPNFWPDFFAEARRQHDALAAAGDRDARYRITIDCFDKLGKVHFKEMLMQARISLTTDVRSLDPEAKTGKPWDRTFLSPADRRQAR